GAVDILVRAEFLGELFRLRTKTNCDGPESHPSRVLNTKVSESPNALDRDERSGTQAGIPKRIEGRDARTQQRCGIYRLETAWNRYRGARFNGHDLRVAAVNHDAGEHRVNAVDEVSSQAGNAGAIPSTRDPNSDALAYRTGPDIRADGINASDDLMPRHSRISQARNFLVYEHAVRMTYTASLDPNADLTRTWIL